jgi:DNA-binding IclR family transcriptional regulator
MIGVMLGVSTAASGGATHIALQYQMKFRNTEICMSRAMSTPTEQDSDQGIKSLKKVMQVLDCFSINARSLSLMDISRKTKFPKSTCHRILSSMREVGLLDQDRERESYRLGLRLFEYGNTVLSNLDLHREALPTLEALRRLSGQTVHLAVFDGLRAIVIHSADASQSAVTHIENSPAHCTSVGKAILAFQPDEVFQRIVGMGLARYTEATITDPEALAAQLTVIRQRGYAVDEGEHQPGLRCIGAPIRDRSGRVFAAVSISGPSWEISAEKTDGMSKIVMHHAGVVSQRLGYAGGG